MGQNVIFFFYTQTLKEFIRVDVEIYIVSCDGIFMMVYTFKFYITFLVVLCQTFTTQRLFFF